MKKRTLLSRSIAAFAISAMPLSLFAQSLVPYTGASGGDYATDSNWTGGVAPADDLTTNIAGLTGGTVDLAADRSVAGIDVSAATTLSGAGILTSGDVNDNGLTGSGDLTITGAGLTLTGVDSSINYTGDITVGTGTTLTSDREAIRQNGANPKTTITLDGGTLSQSNNHLDLSGRDIVLTANGGTLVHVHNRNIFGGYVISGVGQLTLRGENSDAGRVQLTEANTYTGGTLATDGAQLWMYNNDSIGTGDLTLDNGDFVAVNNNNLGTRAITIDAGGGQIKANGKSTSIGGVISGSGDLLISNGGVVELNTHGNTGYSGDVTIDNTEVRFSNGSGSEHLGTGTITLDNGGKIKNRNNNNTVTINNDIVVGAGGGTIEAGWNRDINANGDISGSGLLTIADDSKGVQFYGNNTYSGGTTILGAAFVESSLGTGAIDLGNANTDRGLLQNRNNEAILNNDLNIIAGGGRLKAGWSSNLEITGVTAGTETITVLGDSGTVVLSNTGNTFSGDIVLEAGNSNLSVATLESGSYDGIISGDGNLTITDSLDLEGANTFVGSTTVASSGILGGDGSIDGDLIIEAGGKLRFDGDMSTPLSVAGAVSLDSTFGVDDLVGLTSGTADGTYTLIDETATVFASLGIENWGLANAYDLGGGTSAYFQDGSLQLVVQTVAVPEPSSLALLGLGCVGLISRRRRQA